MRHRLITAGVTIAATGALVLGGGAWALAGSGSPATATTGMINACIRTSGKPPRLIFNAYTAKVPRCPLGSFAVHWPFTDPDPAAPDPDAAPSATATVNVTNRDDSGAGGNWAIDTFTRVTTVTQHGAVSVSHCGGTDSKGNALVACYYYTATISDNGSFTTVSGAMTPNQHSAHDSTSTGKINGVLSGTMTGGSAVEFYAGSSSSSWSPAPSAANVPASVSGDTPSTTDWVEQFFPAGTTFPTPSLLNWSWSYTTPTTCEHWVDAYSNGSGNQAGDGNIAGNNQCA